MNNNKSSGTSRLASPAVHGSRAVQRDRRSRVRRRRAIWLSVGVLIAALVVAFGLWQGGAFAKTSVATARAAEPANLLPLAEPQRQVKGEHDMQLLARVPEQTPLPAEAPVGLAAPKVDLPALDYDFGVIPAGPGNATAVFYVQNTGDAPLVITNLVTSCGCTKATLTSSVIAPGRRADLTVTFDPDFHPVQGSVIRQVWFATNDVRQAWVEVRVRADVQP